MAVDTAPRGTSKPPGREPRVHRVLGVGEWKGLTRPDPPGAPARTPASWPLASQLWGP